MILMFFIRLIVNYRENLLRIPVSINIFLKNTSYFNRKRVFQQFGQFYNFRNIYNESYIIILQNIQTSVLLKMPNLEGAGVLEVCLWFGPNGVT
jgi:hypothetical protein